MTTIKTFTRFKNVSQHFPEYQSKIWVNLKISDPMKTNKVKVCACSQLSDGASMQ
jgi:hypothetical protein